MSRLVTWSTILLLLVACGMRDAASLIVVEVDGQLLSHRTEAATVREVLDQAQIRLGPLDRVTPDLVMPVEGDTRIVITRVREELIAESRTLPFTRHVRRDEVLPDATARVLQLGANGREETTYRVHYENGREVGREVAGRRTIISPRDEIVIVGASGVLAETSFKGLIAYLSHGNAWVMRDSTSAKRPLTFTGDLDGRVFALAPEGDRLLFTRRATVGGAAGASGTLNSLWQIDTRTVADSPTALGIEGVLYADWLGSATVVYSTAERTLGTPGWRARNDLLVYDITSRAKQSIIPPTLHAYGFWGITIALAPDRRRLAYASADEIGLIDVASRGRSVLQKLPAYQTQSDWVWIPDLSWSPDKRLIAASLHSPPPGTVDPERAPIFDLWLVSVDGGFAAPIVASVGMFASPAWSSAGRLAFAQAQQPLQSADSSYDLYVMDADGSNRVRLFPDPSGRGMTNPQFAWSADGTQLVAILDGNLFLVRVDGGGSIQITADSGGSHPRWR